MAFLAAAAPYLQAASTIFSVVSDEKGASIESRRLRGLAGQERATSQRASIEERRQADLAQSRARAVAASSGAGATDSTVLNIMDDIESEGEYRALTRLYEGDTAARSLELEAAEGKRAARGRSISKLLSAGAAYGQRASERPKTSPRKETRTLLNDLPPSFATKYA